MQQGLTSGNPSAAELQERAGGDRATIRYIDDPGEGWPVSEHGFADPYLAARGDATFEELRTAPVLVDVRPGMTAAERAAAEERPDSNTIDGMPDSLGVDDLRELGSPPTPPARSAIGTR